MKELAVKITLIVLSIFLSSYVLDKSLAFFGFPTESPGRYAHPPNFREIRKNIEFTYEFVTNSEGLRYKEISLKKTEGSYRVLVIGDSFTEGWGVQTDERFSSLLEKSFEQKGQQILFINGGLSGTGPLQYGKIPFQVDTQYNLDGILIAVFLNDLGSVPETVETKNLFSDRAPRRSGIKQIAHLLWPRTFIILRDFQNEYQYRQRTRTADFVELISKKALDSGIDQVKIDKWKASLPADLVAATNRGEFNGSLLALGLLNPNVFIEDIDIEGDIANAKWRSFAAILSEIVNRCREAGWEVAIVFIPERVQYDPDSQGDWNPLVQTGVCVRKEWLSEQSEIQRRLKIWSQEENVPFLDLTPVFREAIKANPKLNFKLDGHWNPAGHFVASKAIEEWLRSQTVFSFIKEN